MQGNSECGATTRSSKIKLDMQEQLIIPDYFRLSEISLQYTIQLGNNCVDLLKSVWTLYYSDHDLLLIRNMNGQEEDKNPFATMESRYVA